MQWLSEFTDASVRTRAIYILFNFTDDFMEFNDVCEGAARCIELFC
jgi:hypothetical protein